MKHRLRQIFVLAVALTLTAIGAGAVQGQTPSATSSAAAPRVIGSTPAQREVVKADATIQLLFDQPMDRSSTAGAFKLDPKVDGKLDWRDDSTVTFTPSLPLTRGQEYHVSVGTGAKSQAGLVLEDTFSMDFAVVSNLSVSQVVPAPDSTQVEAQATITVAFSQPVVPLVNSADQGKLPQPLTIAPAVDGKGEWVGTAIYVFHPTKALAGGTIYSVTVGGDLKDVNGSPLDKPYTWKFTTIAPQILDMQPAQGQQVPLSQPIEIHFNQPMDQPSTQAAFSLRNIGNGKPVAGSFTFSADGAMLTFTPTSPLELGTAYQVSILSSARSASGSATLTNPKTYIFQTVPYPAVVNTNPANGSKVAPGGGVTINFNAPMDQQSFAGKVQVDPKPDTMTLSSGGASLYIGFQSKAATTYTVTLDAGAADPYGNTIKTPTVITFTTTNYPPSFGLSTKDVFAVTSAYRADTEIVGAAINVSEVDATLTALEPKEYFGLFSSEGYLLPSDQYKPPRVTRTWSQKVDGQINQRVPVVLKLAGDKGGKLAPGVYYLQVTSPEMQAARYPSFTTVVLVSTASLTLKIGPNEGLVWVTDIKSGQPLSGVKVDIYNRINQSVASGTTDSNGVFHPQIANALSDNSNAPYTAIASGDNLYGLVSSQWGENFQPYTFKVQPDYNPKQDDVYLYTDQPVYRPGHPVYFRGIVRNQDDVTFSAPANESVNVMVTDAQGKQVFQQTMKLNGYAAFNGKYDPPADAPLGNYNLEVQYRQQSYDLNFEVAQFRPPEFLVNATPAAQEVVAGDTIKVGIDSSFYFGGPVSGGKVTWTALANPDYFNYTGDGNYDFGTGYYGYYDYIDIRPTPQRQVGSGTGTLDAKGHFDISLPADLGGQDATQSFTVEATVTDISNQSISGRTTITVHPARLYVGLQPTAYVGSATKPLDVNVITVDWASQPKPNTDVTLKVVERRWEQDPNTLQWAMKAIPVTDGKVTTDAKGRAVFTFTPPRAGIYAVDATARDDGERIAHTITTVWVSGPEFVPWNTQNNNLVLVADKKQYAPGDTASILIPSPFPEPVKALVTVERAGIMKTDVVTISGSYRYKLPMDSSYAPNVYVSVALMRGSGDKDVIPEVRYGLLNLPVTVQQQLKIKITPSTSTAKPGDTVKFDVTVTDLQGKPVAAEVGLSLSDLANLSVGTSNSEKIFDFFWHQRGLSIQTSTSLAKLIDDLTDKDARMVTIYSQTDKGLPGSAPLAAEATGTGQMQAAGAAAPMAANASAAKDGALKAADQIAQAPTPRTNFVDTPLWVPDLTTDTSGHATTQVTLPDNLTTWRLDARGISQKTFVGDSSLDVVSTKPLLVRPSTPRFFVVGDQTELAVVVNNNAGKDLSVNVSLDSKGVTVKGDTKQTISIPKDGRMRVAWQATVQDADNVDLTFSAASADGEYSDASKPEVGLGAQRLLPVYRYLSPDYVSTAGTLTQPGTRTEAVIVPNATLAPTGELTINIQPSLAAATLDGLTYLENYPYQCVEQTVSKFLPNIITFRALQKLNVDNSKLRANLDAAVQYALARLQREQHPDGGWGWFPQDLSNPLTSTYALLGLVEAKAADVSVDSDMFNRALTYVSSTLRTVNDNTPRYEMNRQSFTLYVLARAGAPNPADMDALFARREKTNLFARAFLAQAYNAIKGDQNKINTLLSDLQSAALLSATGTHWEEGYRDWWNWDSDARTTAIVLKTLVDLTPKSDMIPNVVRWLMVARRGDAWESTQETAWAVLALTDWMDVSGELKANYSFDVSVNGKSIGSGKASSDTLRDTTTLKMAVADMLRDQANKVNINHGDGAGNLYYTATLHVNQPVESIQPTNRGIGLSRTYFVDGKPVTSAKVGDTITVALEITANTDLYYVNIDDPIPAGTELLDTSLQTTTQIGQTPQLTEIDPMRRGWGWWWFSNTELRTEKAVLSATYLPKGTYRFVYQVQATAAGTYRVIPPNGNEFYFPEVFGRGAGSLFTITS